MIRVEQRNVFEKYVSVFHPHFIVWVAGMQNSCSSTTGKYAASDNIELELSEDHQKMLFNFMAQINIFPSNEQYKKLQLAIDTVNQVMAYGIKHKAGAGPAMVIYLLEESSKQFIPWMEEVAIEHGITDRTYIEKHGEADQRHASLALEAVLVEDATHPDKDQQIDVAFNGIFQLLSIVFSER
jgi:hypothetical protein